MTALRPTFKLRTGSPRRRHVGLAVMVVLAAVWLGAASRIHVNASWSDRAWGYAAFPLFGEDPKIGDRVLFDPPDGAWPGPRSGLSARVPYLKTVRGVPGMRIAIAIDRTVFLDGEPVGRAKAQALDGRPLEAIAPGIIPPGHYFLHADHRDSHDSRYAEIGLVPRGRILGRAVALPDLPWLGLKGPLVGPEDGGRPERSVTILPHPAESPPPAREEGDTLTGPPTKARP
ncbi:MAG: S26 family signal peptidase [Rhodospirillaceae bacterium]|nr:S26 family signal peptidase [Rhodospirillaceae bacterium]MDE0379674.1 S26 family signal peptidase [Rhodospirillales bacterium]